MGNPVFDLLEPYEPQLASRELVEEVNRIFHQFEAAHYDARHVEMKLAWPSAWREMLAAAGPPPADGWRVLDFGCGTGFASTQLLNHLPAERIQALTCYDLSRAMLSQCRKKLRPRFPRARFAEGMEPLRAAAPHNLLITNSVWHHLPNPLGTLRELDDVLSRDAVWLCGHEPSRRFFQNPACVELLKRYTDEAKRQRAWTNYLRPAAAVARLRQRWQRGPSPKKLTAKEVVRRGVLRREPPARLIDRLVDLHVAHSADEAAAGRGFDHRTIEAALQGRWHLEWVKTFSYMGSTPEAALSRRWQAQCQTLAERFPEDGSSLFAIWRRKRNLGVDRAHAPREVAPSRGA